MRLPQRIIRRLGLVIEDPSDLIAALGAECDEQEALEIGRLCLLGLPPVTSINALAVMTGYSSGFVWALLERPWKYYRVFSIPKGQGKRQIEAPRMTLKIVQKWLSEHFNSKWKSHESVHGFVSRRSHITAATTHLRAEWIVSVDIENFFPSTRIEEVEKALSLLGYQSDLSKQILARLLCFRDRLSQGAPTSPIIANICLHDVDAELQSLALKFNARFTRYADDIVFSGTGALPDGLPEEIDGIFSNTPWKLATEKKYKSNLPQRIKVHGLLVHGDQVRLTKGYRNRIRAYKHLVVANKLREQDLKRVQGHLNYAAHIDKVRKAQEGR